MGKRNQTTAVEKQTLRSKVGAIARRFLGFGMKGQMLCVGEFVLGYLFPFVGVAIYLVQRHKGSEQVWRFFSLAGPIFAMVIYTANFVYVTVTGGVM